MLQLAHLCTLGCWLPLPALKSQAEEECGRKKASSFWDADRLESLCLSIAGNLFSEVKFDREQGLSISPCAAHCLSELGTTVFGNFLVLSLCVMTGMPRPQFAGEVWVQVTAGAG